MGRSFWLLLSGQAVSVLGDFLETIAVGWLVYDLTGSKFAMGSLFFMSWLPEALVLVLGAPMVDRFDRRRLMIALDLARCLLYTVPPVLAYAGYLAVWHLFALQLVVGAAGALFQPALTAMIPSLVQQDHLVRANAIHTGLLQAVTIVGPAFGGLLVSLVGSHPALLLNAATFGLSASSLALLPRTLSHVTRDVPGDTSYFAQVSMGFRFFGQRPHLLVLMLVTSLVNMGIMATNTILIPFVRDILQADSTALGLLQTAWGIGYVVGAFTLGLLGTIRRRRVALMGGFMVQGVSLGGLAAVGKGGIYGALSLEGMFGVSSALISTIVAVIFQRLVPHQLLGRVTAVRHLMAKAALPVGAYLGALTAEVAGIPMTFASAGVLIVLVSIVGLSASVTQALDRELAITG